MCFSSNFYGFEVRENLFAHSPMTTNGLGWLPEIIPLLRKKFDGPKTSRTLSKVAKVKNCSFLKIRLLKQLDSQGFALRNSKTCVF